MHNNRCCATKKMQLRESIRHSRMRVMHQPHVHLFFFVKQAGLRIRAKTELLQNALAQRAPITAAHASSSITKQYLQCSAAAAAAAIPGMFLHLSNLEAQSWGPHLQALRHASVAAYSARCAAAEAAR